MGCSSARLLPALALIGAAAPDPASVAALRALAAADLRVATVAYRLQAAGLPACGDTAPLTGMVVQEPSQYRADARAVAARLFGLRDLPVVTGVVPGGAAARAGLRAGDALVAIDGARLAVTVPAAPGRPDGTRLTALLARLDAALARGPARLTIRRAGRTRTVALAGAPGCRSYVQLGLGDALDAGADGHVVTVSAGILGFARSDDELAFVIGHELAHDILGQPLAGLRDPGEAAGAERERRADYLALYLVAWAGYDVHAATGFWRRMIASGQTPAVYPDALHPATAERIRLLDREAAEIEAARAAGRRPAPNYDAFAGGG